MIHLIARCYGDPSPTLSLLPGDRYCETWQNSARQATLPLPPVPRPKSHLSTGLFLSPLAKQGKIQPRPKGGSYPRQQAMARQGDPPAPAGTRAHPREHIKQWTVRLSQALIEAVKAQAVAEGKEPSHLVEEVLWQALTDRR